MLSYYVSRKYPKVNSAQNISPHVSSDFLVGALLVSPHALDHSTATEEMHPAAKKVAEERPLCVGATHGSDLFQLFFNHFFGPSCLSDGCDRIERYRKILPKARK